MLNLNNKYKPDMGFSKQTTPIKRILLVSADPGLLWTDFIIIGYNATRSALGTTVTAGQVIYLQGNTGTITIVHIQTNTLMSTWTWS